MGVGGSVAVGGYVISSFQSSLMELVDRTRRTDVGSKSSRRNKRVGTCGGEPAREITAKHTSVFTLPQDQLRPILWPLKLGS